MSLAFQVEGSSRGATLPDLKLVAFGASVENVIWALWSLVHASKHCIHVQLPTEGRRFPPCTPVSSAYKTKDMT